MMTEYGGTQPAAEKDLLLRLGCVRHPSLPYPNGSEVPIQRERTLASAVDEKTHDSGHRPARKGK